LGIKLYLSLILLIQIPVFRAEVINKSRVKKRLKEMLYPISTVKTKDE